MSATLAVKPTRREIMKAIVDVARAKAKAKSRELVNEYSRLNAEASKANGKVGEIAKAYGNKKYKKLVDKLKKLILPEFPEAQVFFTVDMEKEGHSNKFKPEGRATIRLVVLDGDKRELDLPPEVRAEMLAANAESERLYKEYQAAYQRHQEFQNESRKLFTGYDGPDYQKLLAEVLPTLGDEAATHLDALVGMVEKALEVPAKPVNPAEAD